MKERKDFAMVRLTAEGRAFAGEGETLQVSTHAMSYVFKGTQAVEVLRAAEWPVLRRDCDGEGNPLFEVVNDAAPVPDAETDEVK